MVPWQPGLFPFAFGWSRRQRRKTGYRNSKEFPTTKRALGTRRPMLLPDAPNIRWSLGFVSDALTDGRRFRVLAVVDDYSRECLALVADTSLSGHRVRSPSFVPRVVAFNSAENSSDW